MAECKGCGNPKKFALLLLEQFPQDVVEQMLGVKALLDAGLLSEEEAVTRLRELQRIVTREEEKRICLGLVNAVLENVKNFKKAVPEFLVDCQISFGVKPAD